jgi:putative hydrolase
MTREWVVIYCDDGSREHTSTVLTAKGGPLRGLRIIAGREDECAEYYERTQQVEV